MKRGISSSAVNDPFPSLGPGPFGPYDAAAVEALLAGPPPTIECRGCGETLVLVRGAIFGIEDAYTHRLHGGCRGPRRKGG